MLDLLDVLLLTPGPRGRAGLPAVFWAPPGVGKTTCIVDRARAYGWHTETVILSLRDPTDVCGLPLVTAEGVRLSAPSWVRRLNAAATGTRGGALLFLDELSCASPATQAAALRVIAEGVVGDDTLDPRVRVLAAANPGDLAAGGYGLAAPTANRLLHPEWDTAAPNAWSEWLAGDCKPSREPARALDAARWESAWSRFRIGVGAYIRSAGAGSLLAVPKAEEERGRAWPSPRSWELAARALAGAEALAVPAEIRLRLLFAAVGEGAGRAAWAYLAALDLPDPEEVLAGTRAVPLNRGDRTWAAFTSVCQSALRDDPRRLYRMVTALEVGVKVAERYADVAASCLSEILAKWNEFKSDRKVHDRATAALASGPLQKLSDFLPVMR